MAGIRIDELESNEAECEVNYRGHKMTVRYFPDKITPETELKAQEELSKDNWQSGFIINMLHPLLISWEITAQDGSTIPIEKTAMEIVPVGLLMATLQQINEHNSPNVRSARRSNNTSARRG